MDKVIIYAELSKRQFAKLANNDYVLCLPKGAKLVSKPTSRGLKIQCDDSTTLDVMKKALRLDGINYNIVGANR